MRESAQRHPGTQPICYFCGQDADELGHALECFSENIGLDLSLEHLEAESPLAGALLLWPSKRKEEAQAMVLFNSTVWLQRAYYYKYKQVDDSSEEDIISRITTEAT